MKLTKLDALFTITYGNKLDMNKMTRSERGGVAFIGRKGSEQGVSGYVQPVEGLSPYPAGYLTVALGGSRLLATYVQQYPFYTAQNVAVLQPRDSAMSIQARLYYATCIARNRFRYSAFGREANRTLAQIEVPLEPPDWVDQAHVADDRELASPAGPSVPLQNPADWRYFYLSALFELRKGSRLTRRERTPGSNRFVGASRLNNGIRELVSAEPKFPSHVLTVAYNGNSVGWAQYQDEPFLASDDVNILVPRREMTKHAMLFVATVLRHERSRYTYGFKWNLERMMRTQIRLPSLQDEPDWGYMNNYVCGLPFSAVN